MGQQFYQIPRVTDEQIATYLSELGAAFGEFQVHIQVATHGLGTVSFPTQDNALWKQLISLNGELVDHFGGVINGVTLHYYRGGHKGQPNEKSPALDDIAIDTQGVDPDRFCVAAKIVSTFRPIRYPAHNDTSRLLDEQRAIQESTFARLENQLEQVFKQTIDVRREMDVAVKSKEEALESEYREKIRLAEQEIEQEKSALSNERADLEARRKNIDDSDNTYARRQIRERMLQDVSDRIQKFGVSPTTINARRPVAASIISLIIFLGAIFLWTALDLTRIKAEQTYLMESLSLESRVSSQPSASQASNASVGISEKERIESLASKSDESLAALSKEMIALWVRLSLVTLGLVATIIYYTRWQNSWADQFSQTEQALKQFHLDINRANWVVETCLEWRKENKSDIPQNLVDSLTKGLFSEREPTTQVLHPADELASALIGSSSKLSLNVGGNTIEIDKPGKNLKPKESGSNA